MPNAIGKDSTSSKVLARSAQTVIETTGGAVETTGFQLLPGKFAFETFLTETFVTAVGGGGRTMDVIHTNATKPLAWETFQLWVDLHTLIHTTENPDGFVTYAIQTETGNYLTAVDGGGLTTDVLHTDAKQPLAWEKFGLIPQTPPFSIYPENYTLTKDSPWYYAIATEQGNYLTALGGGGHATEPSMHSDATQVKSWELFRLICAGPLLSGYQYTLRPVDGFTLAALDGGGHFRSGLLLAAFDNVLRKSWAKFTVLHQADGSYALQTLTGNYVTAVVGGGIGPDSAASPGGEGDVFHTDALQIGSWEKFNILDQGDFTYVVRTVSGLYVGIKKDPNLWLLRTDITDIADAARFRLTPLLA
jgi:hypothetical protein